MIPIPGTVQQAVSDALVRYVAGVPKAVDFRYRDGLPICVNSNNGDVYVMVGTTITKVPAGRATKVKPSDTSRTSTVTLADDPDLTFAIAKSENWCGRCFIDVGAGLTTTGIKVTITAPPGASGNIHASILTNSTSGQEIQILNTNTIGGTLDFTAAGFPPSATIGMMELIWRVANGTTAGNVTVQWAQSTSSGTALVLGAGSQLSADRTST